MEQDSNSQITMHCSHCGKKLRIDRKHIGRSGQCPTCNTKQIITDGASADGNTKRTQGKNWIIKYPLSGAQRGPYPHEALSAMLADGRIKEETLLSDDEGKTFRPARDLLSQFFPGATSNARAHCEQDERWDDADARKEKREMYLIRDSASKGQRGPYNNEELLEMARAGNVNPTTLISDDGGRHFWPARDMLPPGTFSESAPEEHQERATQEESERALTKWQSLCAENEQAVCEVPLVSQGEDSAELNTKQCPYCGETILRVAIVCKHCRSNLTASTHAGRGFVSANDRIASGPISYVDFKGQCNIVAGICGLLLVVSVFLPSVDIGIVKRMFISQAPAEGLVILFTALIVLATAIRNVFQRKRIEIVYFFAALATGITSAFVLVELKSRGEGLASALKSLDTGTRWYDGIGPAMYIMLASAGILFLTWLLSGICEAASPQQQQPIGPSSVVQPPSEPQSSSGWLIGIGIVACLLVIILLVIGNQRWHRSLRHLEDESPQDQGRPERPHPAHGLRSALRGEEPLRSFVSASTQNHPPIST